MFGPDFLVVPARSRARRISFSISTFAVLALVLAGCGSDNSGSVVTPPPPLTVRISEPIENSAVFGIIEIRSITVGSSVDYFLNGTFLGTAEGDNFLWIWDTTTFANGRYRLKAVARAGTQTAEDEIELLVNNAGGEISVEVLPSSVAVDLGASHQFSATVLGSTNQSVRWSIDEGAAFGTLTEGGRYTAPGDAPSSGEATIRATSVVDPTESGTAVVTLNTGALVSVDPPGVEIRVTETFQFTATVTGTSNRTVTWTVEGGSPNGTIDATGFYTAPATVPGNPVVTIRATSVADPSRSATATVTVSPPDPGYDTTFIAQLNSTGYTTKEVTAEAVAVVSIGVFVASIENGGQITATGTVTQSPTSPDDFTYSPTPSDRLVLIGNAEGGGQFTLDAYVTAFSGYFQGTWEDFRDSHDDLQFRVVSDGSFDLTLASEAEQVGSVVRSGKRIAGAIQVEGESMNVDLQVQTFTDFSADGGISYVNEETVTGGVQSGSASLTINEWYKYKSISVDRFVTNSFFENSSSGTIGRNSYQFVDYHIQKESVDGVVGEPEFWSAQGGLLVNGNPVGAIRFSRPVVDGLAGPPAILDIDDGTEIILF